MKEMRRTSVLATVVCLVLASSCASHRVSSSLSSAPGDRSFELALERGLLLLARGEYGKATADFRAAVEAQPDSAKARNYLGLCYFHEKDYERAKDQFEKATAADMSFATAFNNLAGVYFIKAEFVRAEELYKRALALSPDLISANYSLGILLSNLGRIEEGAQYLSRGIALDPNYLEIHKELVTTFSSLSFDMRETYFACAKAYAAAGDIDKTVEYLDRAREAGFSDWPRILRDAEFEKFRDAPRIRIFLKDQGP
jgi:tetratricopeptide (TPR) repeat protein